jgi:hypothetical protein
VLNIQNDFTVFDGIEAVQIIQAGTGTRQLIQHALQQGINSRDAISSDGTYQQGDVKFSIPDVECVVFKPSAGDFILDVEKTLWSIGQVERLTLKTRWQPWCKKVSLRPETAVDLKIYKATFRKDSSGAAQPKFKLWKETKGHINELASEIEVETGGSQFNRRRLKITHQIFIADQLDIQAGWKIVDSTGATWNINRVTGKTSIGVAVTLDVEKSRTPLVD